MIAKISVIVTILSSVIGAVCSDNESLGKVNLFRAKKTKKKTNTGWKS